jgi:hypothetical protein
VCCISIIEEEYVATIEACKEALWFSRIVRDLGLT